MNLTMFYMMLRGAIRAKAELKEVNHTIMYFDRVNQSFRMTATGIENGKIVTREFEELSGDDMTAKLANGTIEYLKIEGDVPSLIMEVDFLTRVTTVTADVKQPDGTIKHIKYNV